MFVTPARGEVSLSCIEVMEMAPMQACSAMDWIEDDSTHSFPVICEGDQRRDEGGHDHEATREGQLTRFSTRKTSMAAFML